MLDSDRLYAVIGDRIRRLREAQSPRMSQEDLAQVLDLKRTSVTNIESGHQKLTLDTLYRLCGHFRLEVPGYPAEHLRRSRIPRMSRSAR